MFLIACYKVDCPTPHFYVDPKGGKISLVGSLAPPQLLTNFPAADIAKIMSVNQNTYRFKKENIKVPSVKKEEGKKRENDSTKTTI